MEIEPDPGPASATLRRHCCNILVLTQVCPWGVGGDHLGAAVPAVLTTDPPSVPFKQMIQHREGFSRTPQGNDMYVTVTHTEQPCCVLLYS